MKLEILKTEVTAKVELGGTQMQIKFSDDGLVDCPKDKYLEVYESLIAQEVVKKPRFVNLTPHDVVLSLENGEIIVFPPSDTVARVSQTTEEFNLGGVPIKRISNFTVAGIPEPETGVIYIVSGRVFEACSRVDLVAPDTTPDSVVKNEYGQTIGVKKFFAKI